MQRTVSSDLRMKQLHEQQEWIVSVPYLSLHIGRLKFVPPQRDAQDYAKHTQPPQYHHIYP